MATDADRRRTVAKRVRCMEPLNHDPKLVPHRWRGMAFGSTEKGKR